MTNMQAAAEPDSPEGLIFLPETDHKLSLHELTLPELDKEKFAVIQLRGKYSKFKPDQQMATYKEIVAAEEAIRARDSLLGGVALSGAL